MLVSNRPDLNRSKSNSPTESNSGSSSPINGQISSKFYYLRILNEIFYWVMNQKKIQYFYAKDLVCFEIFFKCTTSSVTIDWNVNKIDK